MEKFLASDHDIVRQLSSFGAYEYIIIGSGVGGGILSEELANRGKKVLLIEKGGAPFSTHICNTARPDFDRGRHDSPEGNETIYNNIKSWIQTAEDSEPYVGGPMYCLGGRSIVWGLWIPQADTDTLHNHFPPTVAQDLEQRWFSEAFSLVTNQSQSQTDDVYPQGLIPPHILASAKEELTQAIEPWILPEHPVALGPIATQLNSPAPYRFPQGAYSTVVPLLNRIYARDETLSVLMDAEVIQLDASEITGARSVKSLTVRTPSTGQIYQISTEQSKVILCAGTLATASIALNSGLRLHNPLVGKGLIDHAIWGVRFARRNNGESSDPLNLQCLIGICGTTALLTVTINSNFFLAGSSTLPIKQYLEADGREMSPMKGRRDMQTEEFDTIAVLLEFGAELDDDNEVLNIASPNPVIRVRRQSTYSSEDNQQEMQALATRIRDAVITKVIPLPISTKTVPPPLSTEAIPLQDQPGLSLPTLDSLLAPRLTLLGCGVFAHEVGTMRMHAPGADGVVDENLQVDGIPNLHVCDLSVFPYSPPANPALTLAAISLRLAEHLTST